jgi:hypothetical protein
MKNEGWIHNLYHFLDEMSNLIKKTDFISSEQINY